jgi:hypothetical protein
VRATPRCFHWRHVSNPTFSTNDDPPGSLADFRRSDSRHSSDRRSSRLPGAEDLAPVILLAFFVPLTFLVALVGFAPLGRSALEYAEE